MNKINELPEDVEQVLLGSMFGDGSLYKPNKSGGVLFRETHCLKQKDYLLWKKEVLSKVLIMKERYYSYTKKYKNGKEKEINEIRITSLISPLLEKYYTQFYPICTHKIYSIEMLNKLKLLGLSVWYMDDGCFNKRSYNASIALNRENVEFIKKWLKKKFDLDGNLNKHNKNNLNYFNLVFNKENTKKFFRIIHPYIRPSMNYKIKITREEELTIKRKQKEYNHTPLVKQRKNLWSNLHRDKEKSHKSYLKNKQKIKKYHQSPEFKEKSKIYRKKNRDKIKKFKREYYQRNKTKILQRQKEYNQIPETKEKIKKYIKKYRLENKEELKQKSREYWEKNREELLNKKRIRWHKNKEIINKRRREKYKREHHPSLKKQEVKG